MSTLQSQQNSKALAYLNDDLSGSFRGKHHASSIPIEILHVVRKDHARDGAVGGQGHLEGIAFHLVVIGQAMARRAFALYTRGERIKAGRRPRCSCPACGSNVSQTRSPASGTYARATTLRGPRARPNRFRCGDFAP